MGGQTSQLRVHKGRWITGLVSLSIAVIAASGVATADRPSLPYESSSGGNCAGGTGGLNIGFRGIGWTRDRVHPLPDQDLRYGLHTPFNALGAVEEWETLRSYQGAHQQVTESGSEIWVEFRELGSQNGTSNCRFGYIHLDNRYRIDPDNATLAEEMRSVIQHEAGHAMGMAHSGEAASLEGGRPAMSSCLNSGSQVRSREIRSDDRANWRFQNGQGVDRDNALSNPGFELDGYAWGSGGMSVSYSTSGERSGARRAGIKASSSSSFFQTATLVTKADPRPTTIPSIYGREASSGVGGTVLLEAWFIPVRYDTGGDAGCFYTGFDENDQIATDPIIFLGSKSRGLVSDEYRQIKIDNFPRFPTNTGIIVLTVKNNTFKNGQRQWVYLDDASFVVD